MRAGTQTVMRRLRTMIGGKIATIRRKGDRIAFGVRHPDGLCEWVLLDWESGWMDIQPIEGLYGTFPSNAKIAEAQAW